MGAAERASKQTNGLVLFKRLSFDSPRDGVSLTGENMGIESGFVLVEFIAIGTDVGFVGDVDGLGGRVLGGTGGGGAGWLLWLSFGADGMSFDHVHLVERLGGEALRTVVAFVFQLDEWVDFLGTRKGRGE